ncbi:hypothetical protein GOP47_0002215 [Adiantum capillus-veneris]|uniref:MYB transcription factor n=1 Tax=Adiantum capillus-veneris TaxID=13818 RepID=A0A9D4VAB0_ADICA|nr:hypothetical protein GOP47_0002215 [Adiantum capillus-veneris]
MGNPKQKWTPEEEAALRAGVDKHGAGKWRTIQKDPEFQTVLNHRSNVDLKDKWRNMNVGLSGHGSREKLPKSHSKLKGSEECMSPVPMGVLSGDVSAEDTHGNADTLVSSDSSKDRKLLDHRYTELVINAINELKDPNGCGTTAIASYVEAHHPVPSNFRRLLSSKLRDMVSQGNLLKVKQNYKINTIDPLFRNEGMAGLVRDDRRELYQGVGRGHDYDSATMRLSQDASSSDLSKRKFRGGPPRFDMDIAKLKIKTAQEAARAAAVAVAEAEAAAVAAEKAAKEAEAAEVEAEAAELAVELAALAARNPKKVCRAPLRVEDVAIAV